MKPEKITSYRENNKRKRILNWVAVIALMIFYAGTWLFPMFYHVTEIYNTSIIFVCLALLFFNNVDWIGALKKRDPELIALVAACVIALANLFIIGSNKGCILIITNFLLLWYLADKVKFTSAQMEFMCLVFMAVFLVWALIDLAFSYNSNTGASVTVFTFMCAMVLITRLSEQKEIYGLVTTIFVVRLVNLVLWHLARGAFLALVLFLFFYYVASFWFFNRKTYGILVYFSTFGSLLFVFSYVALAATGMNFKMPFFYKNLFSGREQIWMEIWDKLKQHLLTGIGSGYRLESFFEYNIHNVMYDILAVHGVIVFALSMYILIRKMLMMRTALEAARQEEMMNTDISGHPLTVPGREHGSVKLKLLALSGIFAIAIESFIDMDFMWADYSPVILFLALVVFVGTAPNREIGSRNE